MHSQIQMQWPEQNTPIINSICTKIKKQMLKQIPPSHTNYLSHTYIYVHLHFFLLCSSTMLLSLTFMSFYYPCNGVKYMEMPSMLMVGDANIPFSSILHSFTQFVSFSLLLLCFFPFLLYMTVL